MILWECTCGFFTFDAHDAFLHRREDAPTHVVRPLGQLTLTLERLKVNEHLLYANREAK